MRLSQKLGALCAAAALLPMSIASVVAMNGVSSKWRERSFDELRTGARAAARIYEKRLADLRSASQRLAEEVASKALVSNETAGADMSSAWTQLQNLLPPALNDFSLDFIVVTNAAGRVIARHNDRPAPDETLAGSGNKNPLAEKVLSDGWQQRRSPVAAPVVERGDNLARWGLDLRARVARQDNSEANDALMLEAAAPVFSGARLLGLVLIGQMLNNSYGARLGASALHVPVEVEIRQTLYADDDKDAGAVIALGETIIASSIPAGEGARDSAARFVLVGARHDPAATVETISGGGRSFSLSWQAIKALDGSEPGAIGVATSTDSMEMAGAGVLISMIVTALIATLMAGAAGFFLGRSLGARVESLTEAATRMGVGELSGAIEDPSATRPGWLPSFIARDELSALSAQLDQMRESFRQAVDRLRKR
jgi:HAMP domain-containing protein